MPLSTQIMRDGEALQLRWSDFHVAAMAVASACDDPMHPASKLFKEPTDRPSFKYADDDDHEYAGMDESTYPQTPCPMTMSEVFQIASYPMLAMTPLNSGAYTLKREHAFLDCRDGEVLRLMPGDVLKAWR